MNRAERIARTKRVIARRRRQLSFFVDGRDVRDGQLDKQSPFDCGQPQCTVCRGARGTTDAIVRRQARHTEDSDA